MTAKGARTDSATGTQRAEPKRINVAVSPDTVRALENVIEREGVTLTEALRRLIGYGDFVYRAVRENNEQLMVKGEESTREVVIL
ncbi:ribbon-helix-helix domain-containing protein [Actinophytocola xanthii]|uniref:Ribbon-helix-helix protein CopG domain-containing protein n=1 Tax=Actinophytocola xanthii TaxID=1912961 RepID=A0A1Q8CNR0_9PSEU|nr:hypothetical protein [Actinophytocola xanthii]OLF16002.1 hypothetical protein BU204_19070 [Actinophytocola xanthii]